MRSVLLILLAAGAASSAGDAHGGRVSLSAGATWRCISSNRSIDVPAAVPGVAHSALLASGILKGDPFWRYNEEAWAWVAQEAWSFEATFDIPTQERSSLLAGPARIEISGVDTVATLSLNGHLIGDVDNAFIAWEFDLPRGLLQATANQLVISFAAPLGVAAEKAASYPYTVPFTLFWNDWPESNAYPQDIASSTKRNFLRKPPYDFGWDWGPAFIPTGILGNVSIISAEPTAPLEDIAIVQKWHDNGTVIVSVSARPHWAASPAMEQAPHPLRAELCFPDCDQKGAERLIATTESGAAEAHFHIDTPRLWWPRGYGEPRLYEVRAVACTEVGTPCVPQGAEISKRIGLRVIELVEEVAPPPSPDAPNGTTFYFRVNGVPVYAKGSNMIPASVFEDQVSDSDLRWLLQRAADANMNMIRVWGGGRYQRESFYDMADEEGLMVWQELMFACSLYPTDAHFLSSVRKEVAQQVARLAHHASIAIWGGNNENEAALGWYDEGKAHHDRFVVDYVKLYIDTVHEAILDADTSFPPRAWVDSSPSNGLISTAPYTKRWGDTFAGSWGDVHFYNYEMDCEDPSNYPAVRFVSEHGFQSYPSFRAYRRVTEAGDWSRNSEQLQWRQRHENGNAEIEAQVERHFVVPNEKAGPKDKRSQEALFDDYCWLTQLQQARCYETAFNAWRRHRAAPVHNMGILYWQLNDVWQGPTWASIEYDGTPKLAHHAVRRAFAPVLLTAIEVEGNESRLEVHLTSDLKTELHGEVKASLHSFHAATAKASASVSLGHVAVKPLDDTTLIMRPRIEALLSAGGLDRNHSIVRLELLLDGDSVPAAVSYHWLTVPKYAALSSARLTISNVSAVAGHPDRATLRVSSNFVAAYVALESNNVIGAFSDGAFTLLPGEAAWLEFVGRRPFDLADFTAGLRARSLSDTLGHSVRKPIQWRPYTDAAKGFTLFM